MSPDGYGPPGPDEQEKAPDPHTELREAFERSAIGDLLEREPPARRELVKSLIPEAVAGALAAQGGTGKGHLVVQLGLSLATGSQFAGFSIEQPRGVIVVSREDARDESHRRLWDGIAAKWPRGLVQQHRELLLQNLHLVDLVGIQDGVLEAPMIDQIIASARALPSCGLIVLDPFGKLWPRDVLGGMNDQNAIGAIFGRLDQIVRATGCTSLLVVHVNKASIKDGKQLESHAVTGSQQIIDFARFVLNMRSLDADDLAKYGLDENERYVELASSKFNYTAALAAPVILRRAQGGALVHVPARALSDIEEERVFDALCDGVRETGGPLTIQQWEAACKSLEPPIGQKRAKRARSRLTDESEGRTPRVQSDWSGVRGRSERVFKPTPVRAAGSLDPARPNSSALGQDSVAAQESTQGSAELVQAVLPGLNSAKSNGLSVRAAGAPKGAEPRLPGLSPRGTAEHGGSEMHDGERRPADAPIDRLNATPREAPPSTWWTS